MLRVKTNVVDLASCQLAAILVKMSFPQHVFTAANLGVAVKTLCCGRDKFKVYCILNYKYSVYMFSVSFTVILYSSLFLISWHFNIVSLPTQDIITAALLYFYLQKKKF